MHGCPVSLSAGTAAPRQVSTIVVHVAGTRSLGTIADSCKGLTRTKQRCSGCERPLLTESRLQYVIVLNMFDTYTLHSKQSCITNEYRNNGEGRI